MPPQSLPAESGLPSRVPAKTAQRWDRCRSGTGTWFNSTILDLNILASQNREAAVAELAPARDRNQSGILHLALAALSAQLPNSFNDVIEAGLMRFATASAMGIDGHFARQTYAAICDQRSGLAMLRKSGFLDLMQHLEGEAVVDHGGVHVLGTDAELVPNMAGGLGETDIEERVAVGDVIGGFAMRLADRQNADATLALFRRRR